MTEPTEAARGQAIPSVTSDQALAQTGRHVQVIAQQYGDRGWGVSTIAADGFAFQVSPCTRCPWRRDAPTGAFPPEVFQRSARTTHDRARVTFGCHGSRRDNPLVCAGFLLRGAVDNFAIRTCGVDLSGVHSDVPLYDSYREMAIANGVAPDDPALTLCRDDQAATWTVATRLLSSSHNPQDNAQPSGAATNNEEGAA